MHIGIVGCGQLARMMALSGWRLGFRFSFIADPGETTQGVAELGDIVELTPELNGEALYKALGEPDVITVEREHVDTALLKTLEPFCPVCPNPDAIGISQHRGREKSYMRSKGVPTAPFHVATTTDGLRQAVEELGYPVFVKTCEEGYDGRGQWKLNDDSQFDAMIAELPTQYELIVEGQINFDREVSQIAVRTPDGRCAFYPLTENQHQNGILISSLAPAAEPDSALAQQAEQIAQRLLEEMDYVGILSIEFFVVGEQLLVNEIAPRVHNSGHWTQGAGIASQFENHVRGITNSALGESKPQCHAAMINLLGEKAPEDVINHGNVQLHQYNKSLRPNRKVGHINLWDIDRARLVSKVAQLREAIAEANQ
ncbi:MAG: 5-(carboxyamino)imidazole ribonucleotide synthase [Pseudomonadales bacterium]